MNPFVIIYRILRIRLFNKQNHTKIESLYASLNAHYGKNVRIGRNVNITDDVTIGDYSYVNKDSYIVNCDIGKFCSISSGVNISPYNHNLTGITTHPIGDYDRPRKRTVIGNDVLISLNVIIMDGVHIGDGAVIGAGAIVTHDVGNYEIWYGAPARFKRYRVEDENVRKTLSELKWWDMETKIRDRYISKYRTCLSNFQLLNADEEDDIHE